MKSFNIDVKGNKVVLELFENSNLSIGIQNKILELLAPDSICGLLIFWNDMVNLVNEYGLIHFIDCIGSYYKNRKGIWVWHERLFEYPVDLKRTRETGKITLLECS